MKCKEGIDRSKVNPGFLFFFFAWANSSMELPLTEMGETQVEPFWGGGDSGGGPKFRSEYIKLAIPITFRWRCWGYISFFKKIFSFRERGRERERGTETSMCDCLLHTRYWEPGPQPRHGPWLGIQPMLLWLTGWHSIHWATPARVRIYIFVNSQDIDHNLNHGTGWGHL